MNGQRARHERAGTVAAMAIAVCVAVVVLAAVLVAGPVAPSGYKD